LNAITLFNVTTRDTEANILSSTPTNPSGEVNIAFGTDTNDFYIYDGSAWYIYNNDTNFNDSLVFPTIEVFDNESDFITDTGADDYTIVHAKDTDKLYVWDGNSWVIFNKDSTA
jgi:predicted lipoprotein with Yx(FWY)xxD motif